MPSEPWATARRRGAARADPPRARTSARASARRPTRPGSRAPRRSRASDPSQPRRSRTLTRGNVRYILRSDSVAAPIARSDCAQVPSLERLGVERRAGRAPPASRARRDRSASGNAGANARASGRSSTGSRARAWSASSSTSPRRRAVARGSAKSALPSGPPSRIACSTAASVSRFFLSQRAQPRLLRVIVEHRAPPGREVLRGDEARGVRPVLEQRAAIVGEPIERGLVVGAEAAPDGEVVRAIDDVDRVDLETAGVRDEATRRGKGRTRRRAGGGDAGARERARRRPGAGRRESTAPEADASSGVWPLRARASGGRRPGPRQAGPGTVGATRALP